MQGVCVDCILSVTLFAYSYSYVVRLMRSESVGYSRDRVESGKNRVSSLQHAMVAIRFWCVG